MNYLTPNEAYAQGYMLQLYGIAKEHVILRQHNEDYRLAREEFDQLEKAQLQMGGLVTSLCAISFKDASLCPSFEKLNGHKN